MKIFLSRLICCQIIWLKLFFQFNRFDHLPGELKSENYFHGHFYLIDRSKRIDFKIYTNSCFLIPLGHRWGFSVINGCINHHQSTKSFVRLVAAILGTITAFFKWNTPSIKASKFIFVALLNGINGFICYVFCLL